MINREGDEGWILDPTIRFERGQASQDSNKDIHKLSQVFFHPTAPDLQEKDQTKNKRKRPPEDWHDGSHVPWLQQASQWFPLPQMAQ